MLLPDAESIYEEQRRRWVAGMRQSLEKFDSPDFPAWPPEADEDHWAWMEEHWPATALEDLEIWQRDQYYRRCDTAMGTIALAVWELRHDHAAAELLLESVGLPIWPAGSDNEAIDDFTRNHWGGCDDFSSWWRWAPLSAEERREAHARAWLRHLDGEARQERSLGRCWWRTCCDPPPQTVILAYVDMDVALRLAEERGHDEAYPRPDEIPSDEG